MTDLYFKRDTCRLCNSTDVELVIPLQPMPIATPNFQVPDGTDETAVFKDAVPLELYLCRACGHLQILHVGNREIQYSNYVYTTSISLGLREHFARFAEQVTSRFDFGDRAMVMEFGSNDGTLLRFFKERGKQVMGIDPAKAIGAAATAAGIPTVTAFFSEAVARGIRAEHGPAKILIANNVIANIDDMDDIALGVHALLDTDGVFVSETQYGVDVIDHTLLDTVYHEHLSYFNVKPLAQFFARHGMALVDVEHIDTKGGSIRFYVQHEGGPLEQSARMRDMIKAEEDAGFYEADIYRKFTKDVTDVAENLQRIVAEQKALGKTVAGYGVSVGTTAMLPQFSLAGDIDFFVDDDPNKDPMLSGPGYDIPVFGPDEIYARMPGAIIIFAWRYAPNIIPKHARYTESGGIFVVPLPRVRVEN
jgi:hypothetical protein